MTHWIRIRGALALIALSIGWGIGAVACGALADAETGPVLWATFQRLFLVLAMGSSMLGIAIIISRTLRHGRSTWRSHGMPCFAGLVGVTGATWWALASVVTTGSSVMVLALTLASLLLLERRLPDSADDPDTAAARLSPTPTAVSAQSPAVARWWPRVAVTRASARDGARGSRGDYERCAIGRERLVREPPPFECLAVHQLKHRA